MALGARNAVLCHIVLGQVDQGPPHEIPGPRGNHLVAIDGEFVLNINRGVERTDTGNPSYDLGTVQGPIVPLNIRLPPSQQNQPVKFYSHGHFDAAGMERLTGVTFTSDPAETSKPRILGMVTAGPDFGRVIILKGSTIFLLGVTVQKVAPDRFMVSYSPSDKTAIDLGLKLVTEEVGDKVVGRGRGTDSEDPETEATRGRWRAGGSILFCPPGNAARRNGGLASANRRSELNRREKEAGEAESKD